MVLVENTFLLQYQMLPEEVTDCHNPSLFNSDLTQH